MKAVVTEIASRLVAHPDEVAVARIVGRKSAVVEVRCRPDDVERIVGSGGQTIGAIRAVVAAVGARSRLRTTVEVVGQE